MDFSTMSLAELFGAADEIGSKYQEVYSYPNSIYEYRLTVANNQNDTQNLTATFNHSPSFQDWQDWLSGWFSCGYSLSSVPALIRFN